MSQFANNQEGSFEFPPRQSTSADLPIISAPAMPDKDSHSEVLSQAELDRIKAEKLIASFSDGPPQQTSFISFTEDADARPGDFAASDPYVNTQDTSNVNNEKVVDETEQAVGQNADPAAKNFETNLLPAAEGMLMSQEKSEGVTDLSASQGVAPEKVRTVDEILSSIPGYEAEPESTTQSPATKQMAPPPVDSLPVNNGPVEQTPEDIITKVETIEAAIQSDLNPAPTQLESSGQQSSNDPQDSQTPSGILKHAEDGAEIPVSWFSQPQEQQLDEQATATSTAESDLTGATVVSTIVDPVSGEEGFDVRDFSEMADAEIQPIPNAYNDGGPGESESVDGGESIPVAFQLESSAEKIHSPVSYDEGSSLKSPEAPVAVPPVPEPEAQVTEPEPPAKPQDNPVQSSEQPKKQMSVTTVMPVVTAAGLGLAAAANSSPEAAVPNALSKDVVDSPLVPEESPSEFQPSVSSALPSMVAATESVESAPSELGQLAKTPKPTPAIEDSEIAAALEMCADIPEPVPDLGVPSFQEETFEEPDVFQPAVEGDDKPDKFLVDEGDVIVIDGNDGYEFIDLACFDQSVATIEPGRIVIVDEANSTFEVQFKNIEYVVFAGGVRVDLPSRTS